MEITKAKNVMEAVRLASQWKTQGKYDWFRGQTHLWKIIPTIGRPNIQQEEVYEKLERFYFWLQNTPGLEYLAQNVDEAMAVAQHYGMPTSFVDFTTNPKVAGFFATNEDNLEIGQDCCIYCLNTNHLADFWNTICKIMTDYPKLEFLKLEVKDLWRLEAQEGVFLYCPLGILEDLYSIDRIIFPYGGKFEIPIEEICPVRKSHLEILLDQFFAAELSLEGNKRLKKMAQQRGIKTYTLSNERNELDTYFFTKKITKLDSWSEENLKDWFTPEREMWKHTFSKEHWEFEFSFWESAVGLQSKLEKKLNLRFAAVDNFRRKLVDWTFRFEEDAPSKFKAESTMQQTARRIFDGMRNLPYTNEEIAKSISIGLALNLLWLQSGTSKFDWDWANIFKPFIPDEIELEFSALAGVASRGFASNEKLFSCVREDISDLIKPEFKERFLKGIIPTIQFIIEPDKLYEFQKLKGLFVEELIPVQAVIRDLNFPIYFTPARLSIFGLA